MRSEKDVIVPSCLGIPMKWISLLMLVIQTVSVVFAMRLSRTVDQDGPRYLNTTAVFFSEVVKFVCSFFFLCHDKGSVSLAFQVVRSTLFQSFEEVLKISVPSILYTLQNNLLFVSLSNLSGAVYQVTYQLKILTTAVLSVVILGKALGSLKWFSLLLLTSGVACIQFPRDKAEDAPSHGEPHGNTVVGLIAVLSACMTSGLAGVYLEKILKQSSTSIWLRNMQLALFGVVISLGGCLLQDGSTISTAGFMQGYSPLVWSVIWLQALGGLVVAAVLKYADNILKCFGNALSIVMSCILSSVFLKEFEPDMLFLFGTILVLLATTLYNLGAPQWAQQWRKHLLKVPSNARQLVMP
uniref:UDP-galactose transporter n=1 Tax=Noctiluca scintillans TaxID=2966 RepID=A0A6T8UZ53_NOCSC